jgi:glycosyltransferase involved in cell wall biosynthesis
VKLNLAYYSPLNPIQSGISDYSEDLLPYLAHYARLDLFVDNYIPTNQAITSAFAVYTVKTRFKTETGSSPRFYNSFSSVSLRPRKVIENSPKYDAVLFHMGNSAAHNYIFQALKRESGRGILVLHDYVLHHFIIGLYLNNGKAQEYIKLMANTYGAEGEALAREVIKGKFAESLFRYPLCDEAIRAARAVLVHSQYAKKLIEGRHPDKLVGVARMGVPLPPADRIAARHQLGLPQDQFIITSLGHINPYKRLDSALWAFRAFNREYPNSCFILVGSVSPNYDVRSMITALGLENKVILTGYADGEKYLAYQAAGDVCVNLRYPTAGETSASLLRILGAGRAVLVSRTGSFAELPDDVCIKIDVDDAEEELILEYLRLLARNPELREALGRNARYYVAHHARLSDAAHDYYLFLSKVLGFTPTIEPQNPPIDAGLPPATPPLITHSVNGAIKSDLPQAETDFMQEIAQAAAEIGMSESDPALEKVAEAVKFVSP